MLHSGCILLRTGEHILIMRDAVYNLVGNELDFDNSGWYEQPEEDLLTYSVMLFLL